MKKPSAYALYAVQIVAGVAAAAVAYALMPRPSRRGQVVVITGGSRGLGLPLAEKFGRETPSGGCSYPVSGLTGE